MSRVLTVVVLLGLAAGASGCLRTQAKTPDPPPSLTIPTPPERIHLPVDTEPPPVEAPPPATDPASTEPARSNPPARSTPPATPPPAPPTPPTAPPEAPAPVLQPQNMAVYEKRARDRLREAQKYLTGVNVGALSANGRDQYYQALRHVNLAEIALNAKNFLYADRLANNAATLARLLAKK